jgi:cytochrome c oxidase subunit 3
MNESKNRLFITIFLGTIFIVFQAFEYFTSFFCISDGIFGSIFFLATGFHGIHVIIGSLFILFILNRLIFGHFSSYHLIGFEFSI